MEIYNRHTISIFLDCKPMTTPSIKTKHRIDAITDESLNMREHAQGKRMANPTPY